jgi:hypothetical protein
MMIIFFPPLWQVLADYANHEWVHSLYYFSENNTLVALTHMEYHCESAALCPLYTNFSGDSWFSAVTLFHSLDGGVSWQPARPPPAHIVAVSPYQWNASLGAAGVSFGFRSPSSILRARDGSGFYYATVTAQWGTSLLGQQAGACLMRTRDLTDPGAWRAWGGADFDVDLAVSPYAAGPLDPSQHICVPFTNMTYPSLLWSSLYGRYMLFGTNDGDDLGGWVFALSDDLLHWDSWTTLRPGDFIQPGGNATIVPSGVPFSGRFVQPAGSTSPEVWWEDDAHTIKRPVGSCTPCPGVQACGANLTRIPEAEFAALRTEPAYGCGWQFNTTGVMAYFYPTLVDDAAAAAGASSFDEVGADAQLLLVAQMCVNAGADSTGMPTCSPFDQDGLLVRNVVRVPVSFFPAQKN